MAKNPSLSKAHKVHSLHENHPRIRAEDWRSPFVRRLLQSPTYLDGQRELVDSYRGRRGKARAARLLLIWAGLKSDFERCVNTYQEPVLTEFAALGLACVLVHARAGLEITEVTRRGDKVDYWLGDRELLLEVSGCTDCDLEQLCTDKADNQLKQNPFKRDGYVCVVNFTSGAARLWFYKY